MVAGFRPQQRVSAVDKEVGDVANLACSSMVRFQAACAALIELKRSQRVVESGLQLRFEHGRHNSRARWAQARPKRDFGDGGTCFRGAELARSSQQRRRLIRSDLVVAVLMEQDVEIDRPFFAQMRVRCLI